MRRPLQPILAVLVTLALPASASAHKRVNPPSPLKVAYDHALVYTHGAPCHVRITVEPETPEIAELARTEYGSTAIPFSWATNNTCTITLDSTYWNPTTELVRSELLCVVFIHELGNLAGIPETDEPHRTHDVRDYLLESIIPPRTCR